ncbi:MAG: NADH-quinone oxidoreductase subunit H, partial [Planctomycetota bacterium]
MIVDILTNPYVTQILIAIAIFGAVLQIVPGLVYFERKLSAWIQNRVGPNRVGPKGALQPLADVIKLAFKEDVTPEGSDRWIYTLAPVLVELNAPFPNTEAAGGSGGSSAGGAGSALPPSSGGQSPRSLRPRS